MNKVRYICGSMLTFLFLGFSVLSIPVYIFRLMAIYLAKRLKPDLGSIMDGESSLFVGDLQTKNGKPPRGNILFILIFEGHLELQELKDLVSQNWIQRRDPKSDRPLHEKFQQYPANWLGFTFWKNSGDTFSIDKHVSRLSGIKNPMTEEQLHVAIEKLHNSPFPCNTSPWEFYLVENVQHEGQVGHSAIVFKYHHCLADGYSILSLLVQGLTENISLKDLNMPKPEVKNQTFVRRVCSTLTLPFFIFCEMSCTFSHALKTSPWKIPDRNKKWRQVYEKSKPISVQRIKDIKNTFGVSFGSVILSALSAGISKHFEDNEVFGENKMFFMNAMPMPGPQRNLETLTNHITVALADLPVGEFETPVDRLKAVYWTATEMKNSMMPVIAYYNSLLVGCHLHPVRNLLSKNIAVSIALTNNAGNPVKVACRGKCLVQSYAVCGAGQGDIGVLVVIASSNGEVVLSVCAEEAVMSRGDLRQFLEYVTDEVHVLYKSAKTF